MIHLVLGSSGQVGYHLLEEIVRRGHSYIPFDLINSPSQDLRLHQNQELEKLIIQADFVHFLAFDIGGSMYMKKYQDTFDFISNNVKIMNNVFDVLKKHNKPFIFASSQMSNMSYSTYGLLKAIGEKYTEALGGLVVKFWNVYGYELDEEKSHVITDFIKMAKKNGTINMRTDGNESRQFLYGDDCSECLLSLCDAYGSVDRSKPLHITNFEWNQVIEVAKIIQSKTGCSIVPSKEVDTVQLDKKNEPDPYILNFWKPKTSLEDGISELLKMINV